jgi:transglutaminase-like putative cysteine protease
MDYLKPSKFCESDAPEIKALAKRIAGKGKGRAAANAIFKWVRDRVDYRIVPLVGARNLLKRKPLKGMCMDKTNLFVALCRAAGIPARYKVLDCDLKVRTKAVDKRAKVHAVGEVLLNGKWTIADPAFDRRVSRLVAVPKLGQKTWTKTHSVKISDKLAIPPAPIVNLMILLDFKELKKAVGV